MFGVEVARRSEFVVGMLVESPGLSTDAGSFDSVRLSPYFAQDDKMDGGRLFMRLCVEAVLGVR